MSKTYLITGGAGFVGVAVLRLLRDLNPDKVTHVKALDLNFPPELIESIESESKGITFEWIPGDITNAQYVLDAVKGSDVVLHLAGIIPGNPVGDEDTMWKVNVEGTKNVVDACRKSSVTRLVHISSLAVVGPNLNFDPAFGLEEDMPYKPYPITCYGVSKREGEHLALEANGQKNKAGKVITTCAIRPPGIYGANSPTINLVFSGFWTIGRCFSFTNADAKNSSVYVGNLAWAILTAAKQLEEKSDLVGGNSYFIKDDTPDQTAHSMFSKIATMLGIYVLKKEPFAPFWIIYLIYMLIAVLLDILRYFGISKKRMMHRNFLRLATVNFTISHRKFVQDFGYKPIFSYEHALEVCRQDLQRQHEEGFQRTFDFQY